MLGTLILVFIIFLILLFVLKGNIWAIFFFLIGFALYSIIKKEEIEKEKKEEEKKIEEILDKKYPDVFYSSSVLLSDPKWSASVRYGDALMTDFFQHLLTKMREFDEDLVNKKYEKKKPFKEFWENVLESWKSEPKKLSERGKKEESSNENNSNNNRNNNSSSSNNPDRSDSDNS